MKTSLIVCLFSFILSAQLFAQNKGDFTIGLDMAYAYDLREEAYNLTLEYVFIDRVALAPNWSSYLLRKNLTINTLNIDARYYAPTIGKFDVYGIVGFGRSTVINDVEIFGIPIRTYETTENGWNFGYGMYFRLTQHFRIHGQIKYTTALLDDAVMQLGMAFTF